MSNSNYDNNYGQENYRSRGNNDRSSFRNRSGGNRDGGGFRIRLSDNEMKAVRSIQEAFQLKSTVAVLGFSVRTLSEMIEDKDLMESITKFARNNKNTSSLSKAKASENRSKKVVPDPFARPVKNTPSEETQPKKEEIKEEIKKEQEEVDDK
ncbi:hypothetical protein OA969_01470 [Prochlorococcus sp. AH-716-B23]|nr:hypothetical protein [Prochlorococcus sp. AH-716-B23]